MIRKTLALAIGLCGCLFPAGPVLAESLQGDPALATAAEAFLPAVSGYEPSFFGWTLGEEPHARFQVSIKYPFLPFEALGVDTALPFVGLRSGLYVAYTGLYDFYLQRDSAPVISREQNPGLYFAFLRCFDLPLALDLGYFHDSNGQVIDTREKYLAIPDHARDFVSRGWDYLLVGSTWTLKLPWLDRFNQDTLVAVTRDNVLGKIISYDPKYDESSLSLSLQWLGFLNKQGFGTSWKEEDIFWEDAARQPKRSDYDGIRFKLVLQNAHYRLADTVCVGYTAGHASNDLSFTFRIKKWLPLSLRWHCGYGLNLATYHEQSQSVALGFELYDYRGQ